MLSRPTQFAACLLLLVACADNPVVPGTLTEADRAAPFPDLVPLSQIVGNTTAPQVTDASIAQFDSRLARLRARAASLSRPVVDSGTRARMQAAITRAALR